MVKQSPKLSVILPVHNAGSFLIEAIESILHQTFTDFELIIINDGSTDDSGNIIGEFQDPRIKAITQENKGLRATLNIGLAAASGAYIARMDQDDISLPDRFEKQVAFLDAHPDYVLVGATYGYIDEQSNITGSFPALLDDEDIKRELFTKSPFGHGTIMARTESLKGGGYTYSNEAVHMEDYELWIRFSVAGKYANLPEILYLWRRSSTNTTSKHGRLQLHKGYELQIKTFNHFDLPSLVQWLGWKNARKYRNTSIEIGGKRVDVRRHDAHCSLYLNLAWLFFHRGNFGLSIRAIFYAILISPVYIMKFGWKYGKP
ncbi:glycosyltransferase [Patescibacteria group bacterium]|nr:MAG: glycosyltransferase [Patescibacteria group bacterium]